MTGRSKWDERFLRIAREVSTWSKDPGTRVGAVLVLDRRILASGYNGPPAGVADDDRLLDREWKLRTTLHAEVNAVLNAARHGVGVEGSTLYVHGLPVCERCASVVVQSGVRRVVMSCEETRPEWEESHRHSVDLFEECGVAHERLSPGPASG